MLHCIGRDDDIADIDLCSQRSCDTGIDHYIYLEQICQNLGADTCVDLADSTADDDHFMTIHGAGIKVHGSFGQFLRILQFYAECFHFLLHCSDDSDFFLFIHNFNPF